MADTNENNFAITLTDHDGISFEAGTGTGSASTLTDNNKNWTVNQWASYTLKDSASTEFNIVSNTATALTVVGTPATGMYTIRKFIRSKAPIDLNASNIGINWDILNDRRNVPNKKIDPTKSFNEKKSHVIFSGVEQSLVTVNCIIDLDSKGQNGLSGNALIDFITLHNIRSFNHTMYLKDYQGTDTTLETPINALINNTDLVGQAVYNSKGMPVVLTAVTNIARSTDSERGHFITFTLEFTEDKS